MAIQENTKKYPLVVIAGPTASGKTALGVELALMCAGEVVSADSMQLYRDMDIATAKPTPDEMRGVPHHMLGILSPDQQYSVAQYVKRAAEVVGDIHARGKLPILVGGTGLYIDSFVDNVTFAPMPESQPLRQSLQERAKAEGNEVLWRELQAIDPISADKLHPNNLGRVIRAIEIYSLTGTPMSEHVERSKLTPSPYNACKIALDVSDRTLLYERIERRVDDMMERGLLREAEYMRGMHLSKTSMQAIGYKELEPYFAGESSLEECVQNLKTETRRYAKRQLTWFRRDENYHRLQIDMFDSPIQLAERAWEIITRHFGGNIAI